MWNRLHDLLELGRQQRKIGKEDIYLPITSEPLPAYLQKSEKVYLGISLNFPNRHLKIDQWLVVMSMENRDEWKNVNVPYKSRKGSEGEEENSEEGGLRGEGRMQLSVVEEKRAALEYLPTGWTEGTLKKKSHTIYFLRCKKTWKVGHLWMALTPRSEVQFRVGHNYRFCMQLDFTDTTPLRNINATKNTWTRKL